MRAGGGGGGGRLPSAPDLHSLWTNSGGVAQSGWFPRTAVKKWSLTVAGNPHSGWFLKTQDGAFFQIRGSSSKPGALGQSSLQEIPQSGWILKTVHSSTSGVPGHGLFSNCALLKLEGLTL